MADCRASLQVQTRKDIENDVTANFDRLVAMVRKAMAHRYGGRIPPGFEADHWVLEAYRKALDHLDRLSDEPAAHTDFLRRWTRRDYVVAVAINAATDAARPIGDRIAPEEAQQEQKEVPDREAQALEDGVVERLDGARRRTALNVIVRALVWRAGTAGATGITAEQWETMHAFMTVRKASVLDDETDDATLHSEAVKYLQRAREAWAKERRRKPGRRTPPRDGLRTATARMLDISPATVTSHLHTTANAIRFTRYVAGVLAHPQSLQHPACVTHHLNVADALPAAGYAAERTLLSSAADHVSTTERTGTRVDVTSYPRRRVSAIDELHHAETLYTDRAQSAWPNCVTVCDDHTLNGWTSRATEF